MVRLLMAFLAVTALVLVTPALADMSGNRRLPSRIRVICRRLPKLLLLAYLCGYMYLTLLNRAPDSMHQVTLTLREPYQRAADALRQGQAQALMPLVGLLLNLLLYMPLGYLLPQVFTRMRMWQVLLCGLLLTMFTEGCQGLFGIGWVDMNDVVYNVAGVLFGNVLFLVQRQEPRN